MSDDASRSNEFAAPFHVLMSSCQPQRELLKHPSIQKDYFARRYQVLHYSDSNNTNHDSSNEPQEDVWSAVNYAERAMIECCEINPKRSDETLEDTVIDGALMRGKEAPFVTVLARSCNKPPLRALGLAILERTMEQDDWEKSDQEQRGKVMKKEASRTSRFISAGGLKILNQWLIDAMTPVQKEIKSVYSSNESKRRKSYHCLSASPTGPLLLPLLAILKNIPFDKALVTETKINKQIRNLKKSLDDTMAGKKKTDQTFKDPIAGGLVVSHVQVAVEDLMAQWKESIKSSTFSAKDPFASLKEKMQERLELLEAFEAGKSEKPAFLLAFEEAELIAKERKAVAKLSTHELEERERKRDRELLLQNMQREKQEAQTKVKAKMDELRVKLREQSKKRQADGPPQKILHEKQVRWKDGYEQSDQVRQRSILEEVFFFTEDDGERDDQAMSTADSMLVSDDFKMDGIMPLDEEDDDMWA